MTGRHFVEQRMDEQLLERVGCYCSECYREFRIGESAYYDLHEYRYVCGGCAENLTQSREGESSEIPEEMNEASLF
ncbi:hypothetical protein [Nitratifractor sp.]|uniref:hypothetical protein n=1 Tax=Nitratifractor sp. TaxID=2268144 RepID=UPI0025DA8231|nr:hypothetical protein [Nitratifractor sp.]